MSLSTIQSTVGGRYQVIGRIASGGMGEVYRAHDSVLGREVALKVLHPQFAHDRGFVERFRREARAAAILNHPNIVGVYDWGSTEGTYYMVMEFISGHNLRALLAEHGRLEPRQVVEAATQILAALDHAHGHGIVHRDVKPENILVTREGVVKVADFGLARAFAEASISQAEGTVTGTVQYLAPEQIQGDPADPRTDLYALGVVMFECLTGRPPFAGETSVAIAYKHLTDRVPPPSSVVPTVPPALDRAVVHATEKDRANRPASARALGEEVARSAGAMDGLSLPDLAREMPAAESSTPGRAATVTIPRAATPRARRRLARRRWFWRLAIVAAAVVGGWALWTYVVPHYAAVPNVQRLSIQAASARLTEAGFNPSVSTRGVPSTSVGVGDIVKTDPAIGLRSRKGTVVVLFPSTGPPIAAIPAVTGQPQEMARQKLVNAGFRVDLQRHYNATVDQGIAIGTNPDAGKKIQVGDVVTLIVSRGPPPVKIPDVTRQPVKDAINTLKADGLFFTEVQAFSADVPKGEVIRTTPPAGAEIPAGGTVTLIVSKGPKTFAMPSVVGLSHQDAINQLEALGLLVKAIPLPGSGSGDKVVYQDPPSGATVHQGQTVKIYYTAR